MSVTIHQPGLATTVQDRGRTGYYHLGLPQGGALDQYSYELANALVGNTAGEAVLECTYMGPVLSVSQAVSIAVTGAPVEIKVNGEIQPMWSRLQLQAGDELSFGIISAGTRFYIAFAGGIDVPVVMGSRSTYPLGALGGFNGRKLEAGDVLPLGIPAQRMGPASLAENHRPEFGGAQTVRVVLGLYDHRLTTTGLKNLTEKEWTLSPVADRMGMRYDGPGVEWKEREQPFGAGSDPSNIVDAGYAVGSIQIPGGTQPIILHRDAVSGGGYAMVATVISADMDLVARAAPGTVTRFEPVDLDEALSARRHRRETLDAALASLR
ncbi:5-oxoprolinase subunit C family protein [Nesterenkonia flava]|uniref:Biotin-dependent carboxyltransferase family protein n=1 Tax=Nesterenkonia flava TaxID=469799 RepID=A0ABU1FUD7_9MICC|nr:biotin-dependent carboxyltransferase family protein [Nesterenkonia flava]MDR5712238.1 biotin-dependent carboxyltransferase family protein [Nesterenkonia flava]